MELLANLRDSTARRSRSAQKLAACVVEDPEAVLGMTTAALADDEGRPQQKDGGQAGQILAAMVRPPFGCGMYPKDICIYLRCGCTRRAVKRD